MREKHNMKFKSGKRGASRDAFTIILKEMDLLDKVTPEQARKKWTNLSQKYKELKHPPTGTGTEEGEDTTVSWSYFQDMDKVLGGRPIITPPCLVSSFETFPEEQAASTSVEEQSKVSSPPSNKRKNASDEVIEMIKQQHCFLRSQEEQIQKQNDALIGLLGRLVTAVETKAYEK
ncbi:uncharacterized protein LOC119733679 [Patiria miniata]|uniref:Myb/SANT-like DNA-binding domain-containing protein n=1 Tax=Patiria miniata TaxID=46514 RepID=A0A914AH26_PATMI|nr:uncharacterized protein LOC119733679 [Patiria miniata]